MNNIWILAEAGQELDETANDSMPEAIDQETESITTEDGSQTAPSDEETPPQNPLMSFLPLIVIFIVMYFFLMRGPKKKQQKHTQMVKSLQKNDKVQTIGGIIGTVMEVRENEVILKIDETSNTRIKMSKGAIGSVLSDDRA